MRAVLVALVLSACSPAPRVCPEIDATCPPSPPHYAADVAPLIQTHCLGCHYAGSTLAPVDLSAYATVRALRVTVFTEVASCNMPPSTEPEMSEADRATILRWLSCGAMND